MRPGCDHSFGNKLLEVERQHSQVAQHADTHAMFLQVVPKEGDWQKGCVEEEKNLKLKEEQEEQED